jgi:hypothetical protein
MVHKYFFKSDRRINVVGLIEEYKERMYRLITVMNGSLLCLFHLHLIPKFDQFLRTVGKKISVSGSFIGLMFSENLFREIPICLHEDFRFSGI